jgi:thiosulfate reductase cytochrome b subunit
VKFNARKTLYWIANIILPLSETRSIAGNMKKMGQQQLTSMKRAREEITHRREAPSLSFEEALNASGKSVEALAKRYTVTLRVMTVLAMLPTATLLAIFVAALLHPQFWNAAVAFRLLAWTLLLSSIACWFAFLAMVNAWRCWQLRTRRLSEAEQGTFRDYARTLRKRRRHNAP